MIILGLLILGLNNSVHASTYQEIAGQVNPPLLALDSADIKYMHSPIQQDRPLNQADLLLERASAYCKSQKVPFPVWYGTQIWKEASPENWTILSTIKSISETTSILDYETWIKAKDPIVLDDTEIEKFKPARIPLLSKDKKPGKVWRPVAFNFLWCSDKKDEELTYPLSPESSLDEIHGFLIRNRGNLSIQISEQLLYEAVNQYLDITKPMDYLLAMQMHLSFPHSEEYEAAMLPLYPESLGDFLKLARIYGGAKLLETYLPENSRLSVYGSPSSVKGALGALLERKLSWILMQKPSLEEVYQIVSDPFAEKLFTLNVREQLSLYVTENMKPTPQSRLEVLRTCSLLVKDGYWSRYNGWQDLVIGHLQTALQAAKSREDFWAVYDAVSPALDQCACRYHSSPTLLLAQKLLQTGLDQFAKDEDSLLEFIENFKTRKLDKHLRYLIEDKLNQYLSRFDFSEAQIERLRGYFPENPCIDSGYVEMTAYLKCIAKKLPKHSWQPG